MKITVTGAGVVSALGPDLAAFREGLARGVHPCRPHAFTRFDGSVAELPAYLAVDAEPGGLIEPRKLRRMFRLARMSAVAARQALQHAGLDPSSIDGTRLAVVFGTGLGAMEVTQKFIDSWLQNGERAASPLQFMNSLHGILASQVALDVLARGPNLTIAQRDICFEAALDAACKLLETGRADAVLLGGADEMTDMLHEFGTRSQLFTTFPGHRGIDPADAATTVVPGDGAAVVLLERADVARKPLAMVRGTAIGRHRDGRSTLAARLAEVFKPDLVTDNRDGSARTSRVCRVQAGQLPAFPAPVSHRGSFGTFPAAGALQFVCNTLMLAHGEYYRELRAGTPGESRAAPRAILHNATSATGSLAAYVLSRADSVE